MEERIQSLEKSCIEKDREVQALRSQLQKRDRQIEEQEREMEALTEEVMSSRLQTLFCIDDAHLSSKWKQLEYKIRQFANHRFALPEDGESKPGTISHTILGPGSPFEPLTSKARSYWPIAPMRRQLIKAWVWSKLVEHVFGQQGQLWAEDAHQSVGMMRYTMSSK